MKIKKNIFSSIEKMDPNELAFIYEYIKLLERQKEQHRLPKKSDISIEQIHEMTSLSNDSWSETVIEEREDRV